MTPAGDAAGEPLSDPEVLDFVAETEVHFPACSRNVSVAKLRRMYERLCAAFRAPRPEGVVSRDIELAARLPRRKLRLREYRPPQWAGDRMRRLLYLHGGGFMLGDLESHDDFCAEICAGGQLPVVAVDFRRAPEHVFPAALDDAWEAYCHIAEESHEIVVAGDSSGATLSAALCLRARRLGVAQPVRQVLIYPALAIDGTAPSCHEHAETPTLTAADCKLCWSAYAGNCKVPKDLLVELAPLSAGSLAGLAPAFVVTADIDPVRDDGRAYVARLRGAGVAAEWRNEPQLVHSFIRARHRSWRAARSFEAITKAIAGDA